MWRKIKYLYEDLLDWPITRLDYLGHLLRGHKAHYASGCCDLWTGHFGCITCEECPDSSLEDGKHVGFTIWMRDSRVLAWLAQRLCGVLGHPSFKHIKTAKEHLERDGLPFTETEDPADFEAGNHHIVYSINQLYCSRCMYNTRLYSRWSDDATRSKT